MPSLLNHPQAQALLKEATLHPSEVRGCAERLQRFLLPYAPAFARQEQRDHALLVVQGKLSGLQRKTTEPMAHQAGVPRKPVQHFVGAGAWDDKALLTELRRQVAQHWHDPQAVLTIDGSGFPKKGADSCAVARQWCGRLGKVDNCQVGLFVGYACRYGHTLIDHRLLVPEDWSLDTERRQKTHMPKEIRYQTAATLALELLERCRTLPHSWITADDEFGRSQEFRAALREAGERYLVDVPAATLIRDLEAEPPVPERQHGSRAKAPFESVSAWAARQPHHRWQTVEVRAGEKGWVRVEALTVRVQTTYQHRHLGPEERLVVRRGLGATSMSYHLSNATAEVSLATLVQAKGQHHQVEQCFAEGKGEVGLGHYEVRSWVGWHHHMTLSLLALWFLAGERVRLGEARTQLTVAQVREIFSRLLRRPRPSADQIAAEINRVLRRTEEARIYAWFHEHHHYPPSRKRSA